MSQVVSEGLYTSAAETLLKLGFGRMAGGSPMSIVNHLSSGGSKAISTVGLPKPLSANQVAASIRSLLLAFWSRRTPKQLSRHTGNAIAIGDGRLRKLEGDRF